MPSNCSAGICQDQLIALVDHEHRLGERRQDRFNLRLPRRMRLMRLSSAERRVPLVPPARIGTEDFRELVRGDSPRLVGSQSRQSDASVPCANCNAIDLRERFKVALRQSVARPRAEPINTCSPCQARRRSP